MFGEGVMDIQMGQVLGSGQGCGWDEWGHFCEVIHYDQDGIVIDAHISSNRCWQLTDEVS